MGSDGSPTTSPPTAVASSEGERALLQLRLLLDARLLAHGARLLVQRLHLLAQPLLLLIELFLLLLDHLLEAGFGGAALLHLQQGALQVHIAGLEFSSLRRCASHQRRGARKSQ